MTTIINSPRQTGKTTAMVQEIVRVCVDNTIYICAHNPRLAIHVLKLVKCELQKDVFTCYTRKYLTSVDNGRELKLFMSNGRMIHIIACNPYTHNIPIKDDALKDTIIFYYELMRLFDLPVGLNYYMITSTYVSASAIANTLNLQEYTVKNLPPITLKTVPAHIETVTRRLKLLGLCAEKIEEILYDKVVDMKSNVPQGSYGISGICPFN